MRRSRDNRHARTLNYVADQLEEPLIPASFPLGRKWFVCEVYAKSEFRAELALKQKGFDAYSPRSRHFRKSEFAVRRKEKIERALFPGYCFVAFDIEREEWFHPIHTAHGVRKILSNNQIPVPAEAAKIERIRRAEDAGEFDFTIPATTFKEGQDVEIKDGPLSGLIAKIKSAKAKKRIRLILNGLMIDMEASSLARVG